MILFFQKCVHRLLSFVTLLISNVKFEKHVLKSYFLDFLLNVLDSKLLFLQRIFVLKILKNIPLTLTSFTLGREE